VETHIRRKGETPVNEVTLTERLTPKTQNTSPSYQGHYVRLEFLRAIPSGGRTRHISRGAYRDCIGRRGLQLPRR